MIETMGDSRQGTVRRDRGKDAQDLEPSIPTVFKSKEFIFAVLSSSNINLFTYTHAVAHTHIQTHKHTHIYICALIYKHTDTHTHTHTHIYTWMHPVLHCEHDHLVSRPF